MLIPLVAVLAIYFGGLAYLKRKPLFGWVEHLWTAAYNLTDTQRSRTVKIVCTIAAVAAAVVMLGTGHTATHTVSVDHPAWEAVMQSKMVLIRIPLAFLILILAVVDALIIYQVIENSELGKRLLIWHDNDDAYTQAAKTRNAGTLLATLIGSNILAWFFGVLR